MIIQARFVGQDGSLGYRHGSTYRLNVWLNSVRDIEGVGLECPYSNAEAFLRNWSDIRVIQVVGEEEPRKKKKRFGLVPDPAG